jgi:hypothetical protein
LSFVRSQLVCSPYYPFLFFRGPISVGQLAELIEEKPVVVIKFLMTDLGVMASITQNLDQATSAAVVEGFGWIVGGADDEYEDDEDDE